MKRLWHSLSSHLKAASLFAAIAVLTSTLLPMSGIAEIHNYPGGGQIVTLKGLPVNFAQFDSNARGYVPNKGGNDFIIMEQFNNNCGPNSVQMVLYYYRKHRRIKDIWRAGGIRTVEFGTRPKQLRQTLNESGVPAHWYTEKTLADVQRYIRNNRPPILLLRLSNTGYHWVVAVGYDTRYNEILIADPNGRFKWWRSDKLYASWTLEWQADFEVTVPEWYEFQIDVGWFNQLYLNPNTVIVPLAAPSFDTSYLPYWSDRQAIKVYGANEFWGETREWEKTLTFDNPFSIVHVSDIKLLDSTGTARLNGWERVGDSSIKLWGDVKDGLVLRGRMWVIVRTFYFKSGAAAAPAASAQPLSTLPAKTSLLPNYPNPFNPETWIPYQLAKPAEVRVAIYSADGKLVRTLALGHQPAGIYQHRHRAAYWDGTNEQGEPVASGVYFYTLEAGDFTATKKMLIRK